MDWEYKGKLGWSIDYDADQKEWDDVREFPSGDVSGEAFYTQNRIVGTGARIYHKLLAANDAAIAIEWLQGNDPKLLLEIIDQMLIEEVRVHQTDKGWVPENDERGFLDFLETPGKRNKEENVMANGLLKQFDSIRPGETIQGLIDPTWPGLVKGSGTMDPNAAWPLLSVTAARLHPPATCDPSLRKAGSKEIITSAGDVVNLGRTLVRKFPYTGNAV